MNTVSFAAYASATSSTSYVLGILGNSAFLCLLGSRMFINLKKAAKTEVYDGTDRLESIDNIQSECDFAVPNNPHSETLVLFTFHTYIYIVLTLFRFI